MGADTRTLASVDLCRADPINRWISVSRLGGANLSPSQEDGEDSLSWRATERVHGSSAVVCDLDPDSLYAFRVRSCRNSMFSPYSPEVTFHTPPAPGESERNLTFILTAGGSVLS